ncbi:MAG TPA: glucokinase [Thauera sp.]|nr:glucokinase [Thauera sp.]
MSSGLPEPAARLVADIGGTNARFALVAAPGAAPSHIRVLPCVDFAGPEQAVRAYLAAEGVALPRAAAFGIANPVTGDRVAMTNHHWAFSVDGLRAALGLERLLLVNDFTALALSLPHLAAAELEQIGDGQALPGQTIALLGAGTGLGISGLVPAGDTWVPLQGEGGHVTLPAGTRREANLIALLAERYGHASAERVLSGPGLVAVHDALRDLDGLPALALDSATISARGLAGQCPVCAETLHLFCALLGTVAGDLALTLGARGGVFVGGGIVPRLGAFFARSAFRERFLAKGRFRSYLEPIPTRVIRAPYAALTGAAHALDTAIAVGFDSRAPQCPSTIPSTIPFA